MPMRDRSPSSASTCEMRAAMRARSWPSTGSATRASGTRTRSIYRAYGLTGQPETFLVDSEGIVIDHVAGPLLRREELFTMLDILVSRDG